MGTLNDIPESLREDQPIRDWTPELGLRRGTIWTVSVAVVLMAAKGSAGLWIGPVVYNWFALAFGGLVLTCVLFAVMHKAAGMAGTCCTIIVIGAVLLVELGSVCLTTWASGHSVVFMNLLPLAYLALPGLVVGTLMCKDGGGVIMGLVDIAMTNPLTGRRT